MKVCCVCGKGIRTDLEEFGDPREPVCASCWLAGEPKNEPQSHQDTKKKHEECVHEEELFKTGYSYDHDSGKVYRFEKNKCRKCGKVKKIKQYDL